MTNMDYTIKKLIGKEPNISQDVNIFNTDIHFNFKHYDYIQNKINKLFPRRIIKKYNKNILYIAKEAFWLGINDKILDIEKFNKNEKFLYFDKYGKLNEEPIEESFRKELYELLNKYNASIAIINGTIQIIKNKN